MKGFYNAFYIKPGTTFYPLITDLAMNRIKSEVQNAYYELFNNFIDIPFAPPYRFGGTSKVSVKKR